MRNKAWGNEYRSTVVCIDSYQNGVLSGRFFNPYMDTGQTFKSLTQLLIKIDQLLDTMNFPQSYTKTRTFADSPQMKHEPTRPDLPKGALATFGIKILFRQNASWQGSVLWQEGGKEQSFRSVLELVFLMDSVLGDSEEQVS